MIDPRAQLELIPQLADQEQATGVSQVLRVVGQSEGSGRPLHVGPGLHTMKAHRLGASNVRDEFRQELSLTYGYQAVFVFPSIAGFGFTGMAPILASRTDRIHLRPLTDNRGLTSLSASPSPVPWAQSQLPTGIGARGPYNSAMLRTVRRAGCAAAPPRRRS